MIRKYLVCGKQLFLASKKLEDSNSKSPVVELLIPLTLLWEIERLVQRIDYLVASNEDPVLISDLMKKVYRKVVKYAVFEKDRVFIFDKFLGVGPPATGGGNH